MRFFYCVIVNLGMKNIICLSVIAIILFACAKKDSEILNATNGSNGNSIQKPEWRVKKAFTSTTNIKHISRCLDTMTFIYDTLGRFSEVRYRLYAINNGLNNTNYTWYHKYDNKFEYAGKTELLKKIYTTNLSGVPEIETELIYDPSQTKVIQTLMKNINGNTHKIYDFLYNSQNQVRGYMFQQYYSASIIDTTKTNFEYKNGLLTKKVNVRHNGDNVNTFSYDYNAAGNTVFSLVLGQYGSLPPDTMRKIYFTWKPTITPNINKIKRPDSNIRDLSYEWPNFYFSSYNLLVEFDIFNLTTNGELLNSYNFLYNRYTAMASKMNFQYQLDSNQNINKVIGTVSGNSKMEMSIEYEKIN